MRPSAPAAPAASGASAAASVGPGATAPTRSGPGPLRRLLSLFNVLALLALLASAYAYRLAQRPPEAPKAPPLELVERHGVPLKVYYSDGAVQTMKPVTRTAQVTEENPTTLAQAALNVWAQGPGTADGGVLPVVPGGTPAPRVYVRGAHHYVDLLPEYTKLNYGSSGERMLLCTITRTLLERGAKDVTFLVGGQMADTLRLLDLRRPFTGADCTDT